MKRRCRGKAEGHIRPDCMKLLEDFASEQPEEETFKAGLYIAG